MTDHMEVAMKIADEWCPDYQNGLGGDIAAALAAAEERGRIEERERCENERAGAVVGTVPPSTHESPNEDVVETVARRIYEDANKGMRNIWGWDDGGLDDEHPGTRKRYLTYAQSAVSSIEELSVICRTKALLEEKYVTGNCSDSSSLQDLLFRLDRQEVADLIGGPNAYADPLLCADAVITYALKKAREVIGDQPPIGEADLDGRALNLARKAYDRKFYDMSCPTPTEEPEAGGGPIGYAIRAYISATTPSPRPMASVPVAVAKEPTP